MTRLSHAVIMRGSTMTRLSHAMTTRGSAMTRLSHAMTTRGSAMTRLSHAMTTRGSTMTRLSHAVTTRGSAMTSLTHAVIKRGNALTPRIHAMGGRRAGRPGFLSPAPSPRPVALAHSPPTNRLTGGPVRLDCAAHPPGVHEAPTNKPKHYATLAGDKL